MVRSIRYTCVPNMLPTIEVALALHGYYVELPCQRSIGGASAQIMSRGATSILLGVDPSSALALIEIWGVQQEAAARLLESLPIDLIRQPSS